ncbi:hypothetical protein ACJMK2_010113 [Sinanodonta woodiana]|uniref:TAFH domain-containing protein n=1 Tax=Sinanodonta woodiana TaxID=1069815 RepID=A0ABD3VEC2_SINWO
MAAANPLEDLLSTPIDESAVSALVGSLETRLASPTNKDPSQSLSELSVNSNHINTTHSQAACTETANIKSGQFTNSPTVNNLSSNAKACVGGNQVLSNNSFINSHSSINANALLHTNVNSRTDGKVPNATHAIRIVTHATNSNNQITTSPFNSNYLATVCSSSSSSQQPSYVQNASVLQHNFVNSNPSQSLTTTTDSLGQKMMIKHEVGGLVKREVASPAPQQSYIIKQEAPNSQFKIEAQNVQFVQNSGVGKPVHSGVASASQTLTQKTNVHIVHNTGMKGAGANPGVITVRTQPQMTVVRPQVVTSQIVTLASSTMGTPVTQGKVQARIAAAPVRIGSSQQPQINIAPRPGTATSTITLPSGLVPQGTMLMKNEQGQLVIVQHSAIQHQATTSATVMPSSTTGQKIQYVRPPMSQSQPQRLPGQLVTIQQQPHSQPQTVVRQAVHSPVVVARPQVSAASTAQVPLQAVVRTVAPGVTATIGQPQQIGTPGTTHIAPTGATTTTASYQQQIQMLENVKKCKNFLSTLIKLASSQPEAIVRNVRDLIQGLIDGKVEPEVFTEKLQKELKSSPQPYLVPFIKKSLPLLRQSLISNKMTIEGVRAPPISVLQQTQIGSIQPISPAPQVGQVMAQQNRLQVHLPLKTVQGQNAVIGLPKAVMAKGQPGGNIPSMVNALHSQIIQTKPHESPGGSSHKEKKKYDSLKDDDDINDVATMGGVNLTEETKNILATNADFIGTQIRSCKDECFLFHGSLYSKISAIAKKKGIDEVSTDVLNIVSHATQERLRYFVERLSTIAEHRSEIYKINDKFEPSSDVRAQLKFLEELDHLEKKRHEEQEKEMLRRAAKSRSKHEDPEQLKLKQKAKELQQAELEEVRQRDANLAALAAIGPRKKRKLDTGDTSQGGAVGTSTHNGLGSAPNRSVLRPRIKRVNLRDVIFLMEQERTLDKSLLLYKSFLK